jgi:hypothetical protein
MQLKIEDKNYYSLPKPLKKLNAITDTTSNYRKRNKIILLIRLSALFFCLSFWYVIYRLIRAIF